MKTVRHRAVAGALLTGLILAGCTNGGDDVADDRPRRVPASATSSTATSSTASPEPIEDPPYAIPERELPADLTELSELGPLRHGHGDKSPVWYFARRHRDEIVGGIAVQTSDGGMSLSHAPQVVIDGKQATIVGDGTGPWHLFWDQAGVGIEIRARGVDRAELLQVAEAIRAPGSDRWSADALGSIDGFELVGGGVRDTPLGEGEWVRTWNAAGEGAQHFRSFQVRVGVEPANGALSDDEAAVERLVRGENLVEVGGRTAGLLDLGVDLDRSLAVRWQEEPGLWVNVSTRGMPVEEVLPLVATLQVVDEARWEPFVARWR